MQKGRCEEREKSTGKRSKDINTFYGTNYILFDILVYYCIFLNHSVSKDFLRSKVEKRFFGGFTIFGFKMVEYVFTYFFKSLQQ